MQCWYKVKKFSFKKKIFMPEKYFTVFVVHAYNACVFPDKRRNQQMSCHHKLLAATDIIITICTSILPWIGWESMFCLSCARAHNSPSALAHTTTLSFYKAVSFIVCAHIPVYVYPLPISVTVTKCIKIFF